MLLTELGGDFDEMNDNEKYRLADAMETSKMEIEFLLNRAAHTELTADEMNDTIREYLQKNEEVRKIVMELNPEMRPKFD